MYQIAPASIAVRPPRVPPPTPVLARAPVTEIAAAALANGMLTLKQEGIKKVLKGETEMQQVRAV